MLRTKFLYHVLDDPAFKGKGLISASIPVVPIGGGVKKPRQMYSLKGDLDELRKIGAGKGIVDASVADLGIKTRNGRDLLAIKVGNGAAHKVLVLGCHHAREWISVEMAYYIAEYLITAHPQGQPTNDKEKRIKHLLMNRQIWFVPMVNPDGHNQTITTDRMWRQNNNSSALKSDVTVVRNGTTLTFKKGAHYNGVDVNRNYDTSGAAGSAPTATPILAWGVETFHPVTGDVETSRDPADSAIDKQVFCGESAASEQETKAVQKVIADQGFRSVVSFHSFSEEWLWPGPLTTGSGDPYVDWVGKGAEADTASVGDKYTYKGGPDPYPTSGDMVDFAFQNMAHWRPAYTPEVRPKSSAPASEWFSGLSESEIEPCFKENLAATLAVINCAGFDAQAAAQKLSTATAVPPQKGQFVRHCWEVFRGWTP